ncbi:MAG: sigma-70 family RNA polymerase sigma factor [Acidobacteria bacterium]|nr:sigma-70 family RNA polymerase sigma factor [Acidobacteriota bacterium]MBI3656873.1 sigma-70 family RNA polymerase sigma factor [Acidobacteriota bacterium]
MQNNYLRFEDEAAESTLPEAGVAMDGIGEIFSRFSEADGEPILEKMENDEEEVSAEGKEMEEGAGHPQAATDEIYDVGPNLLALYLREMSTVTPPLTPTREVIIAKKIEKGENLIRKAVSRSPLAIQYLIGAIDSLKYGTLGVRAFVRFEEDEITEKDIERKTKETIVALQKIAELSRQAIKLRKNLTRSTAGSRGYRRAAFALIRQRIEISRMVKALNLVTAQQDRLIQIIKSAYETVSDAERRIISLTKRVSHSSKHQIPARVKEQIYKERERIQAIESEFLTTAPEIKRTVQIIRRGKVESETGKQVLTEANLRLVFSIAKGYTNKGLPFLDLIQEGNIGLMKAVDRFDYKRGYKFSTYATWWIRQAMSRALQDRSRTIRLPCYINETIAKLIRIKRDLEQKLRREPTTKEVAKRMHMTDVKVTEILKANQSIVSLDVPIDDEKGLGDFIADTKSVAPDNSAMHTQLHEQIEDALKGLNPREAEIIRMRFGLEDGREHTLEEVGRKFNITRERVRQIEVKAIEKLKHPLRNRKLKSFLNPAGETTPFNMTGQSQSETKKGVWVA